MRLQSTERRWSDPYRELDADRLHVFVTGVMSVGLVFSFVTLVRDAFRWTGGRARERRIAIEARTVVNDLLTEPEIEASRSGLLKRSTYLGAAVVFLGAALYIAIGATANFLREDGYVQNIGWLLALAWGLSTALTFLGVVSLAVVQTWPSPPAWAHRTIRTAPLSINPNRIGQGPPVALSVGVLGSAIATLIVTLMVVTGRALAVSIDQPIVDWLAEVEWLGRLDVFDPFGSTLVTLAFVALIGLSGFRCHVMAVVYPAAFVIAWLTVEILQDAVARGRPSGLEDFDSFPSGHMVQAVFIAGLVPPALRALFGNKKVAIVSRIVLVTAVVATAVFHIHLAKHWPLDVLAGLGIGATIVLSAHWVLEHRGWHRGCRSCPWSEQPVAVPWKRGVVSMSATTTKRLAWGGGAAAVLAAGALGVATLTVGLPSDPEGSGFGASISAPVQLGLAGLVAFAGLLVVRSRAIGAFLMALCAAGLGLFAAVEYAPVLAFGLTAALMVPAVITWLSWQPTETLGSIAALAVVTATVLTGTGLGAREVHGHYLGPTHPSSLVAALESDADWLWLGGVTDAAAIVNAGGFETNQPVVLSYWGDTETSTDATAIPSFADEYGIATFHMIDLDPDTTYHYVVDAESGVSSQQAAASFDTFDTGAQDLTIALGSCARRGSNGSVFDTIVAEAPDLYLALGDLHYGNVDSTRPERHIDEYGRAVGQPAQSMLFRSVPTAYVWDDHDYGPNDADATSPAREAVSQAYRAAVPNYAVALDTAAPIAQAFTVGRVRVVITDTRSQRDTTTMLGADQLRWLISELETASKTHALVVWANPTPWIGAPTSGGDSWSSYPDERRLISDAIAAAQIANLIMVSGDAHMVAIDDGTNSDYSTEGGAGFPVLHAAALDRPGSVKGGPYSHGTFAGGGQYGLLEIDDDGGGSVVVRMSGHRWDGTELVALSVDFDAAP